MKINFIDLIIVLLSYFIGSISFGIIFTKYFKKKDVREKDYPGTAGVTRQFGLSLGILVFILDLLKGVVVALLSKNYSNSDLTIILSYIFLIIGNNYPIFFNFDGGQGLATTIGFGFTLIPIYFLISFIVGLFFILLYNIFKLKRIIKSIGPIPFGAIFGFIFLFIILIKNYPFYPYPALVIIAGGLFLLRGLQMINRYK